MKTKKLTLEYSANALGLGDPGPRPYKVVRVEHTTEYNPGDFLSKKEVDDLNCSSRWSVAIVAAKRI